jgi:soluble P-type ATPase
MMVVRAELGHGGIDLTTALLDVNGTLTVHGQLVQGVAERIGRLRDDLEIVLVSSDTYGTLDAIARDLQLPVRRVQDAADKGACLREFGPATCVAIGNGNNDVLLIRDAAVGIAVVGPEGLAPGLLGAADIICVSIIDALDLLLDPSRLTATLRP